jgi:lysophospholipase-3
MRLTFLVVLATTAALRPVVIIPGDGGSQLEARLDKPSTVSFLCDKKADWYTLWLSITELLPGAIECWCDNIRLIWNNETEIYTNNQGVFTRTPDFGATTAIEYVDPSVKSGQSNYMATLVDALVKAGGERNVTVRAAAYDFRYGPTSQVGKAYLSDLKSLVESTYAATGNTKVALLSHSMGCIYALYFLNGQTQAWKDQYVHQWLPTSGAFSGTASEIQLFASGDNEGVPGVSGKTLREEQRSYQTNFWLLPTAEAFGSRTLAVTPSRNYTAADYKEFFDATGFPAGTRQQQLAAPLTAALLAPGVATQHFYGTGVDTGEIYQWKAPNFDAKPDVINGDGDGTVNLLSLESVAKWATAGGKTTFAATTYAGQTHSGILQYQPYIAAIVGALTN